jgi:hypothetical protein
MQSRGRLFRVPRMIEFQQPAQHLPPRRPADRVAETLLVAYLVSQTLALCWAVAGSITSA